MKLKLALAQTNVTPGAPLQNLQTILKFIRQAKTQKADIIIFPEMAVTGYMLGDQWEDSKFVIDCQKLGDKIKKESRGLTVIYGNVLTETRDSLFDPNRKSFGNDGRMRKYNAAYILSNGKNAPRVEPTPHYHGQPIFPQEGVTIKTNEPLYRQFEDQRHFLPLKEYSQQLGVPLQNLLQPFKINKVNVGVVICEDIWIRDYVLKSQTLSPARILAQNGADLIICISASPFGWHKNNTRLKTIQVVQQDLARIGKPLPLVYVNCVGAQNNGKNEFLFDGRSGVFDRGGNLLLECPSWEEGLFTTTLDLDAKSPTVETPQPKTGKQLERQELHDALIFGLKEFCRQKKIANLVVGLSGGIDSAMVAYLAVKALGPKHVLAINMPTKFNSSWTQNIAKTVAHNLGIDYQIVPIEDNANLVRQKLENVSFNGETGKYSRKSHDQLVDENLQARIRSTDILAGVSAKYPNTLYTCNGNKTETLLGYFTLDGDGRGAIAPLADVYKTQIADLALDINLKNQTALFPWELIAPLFNSERYFDSGSHKNSPIPKNIRSLIPSAELSKSQDVTKNLGDPIVFAYHDRLLRQFTEYRHNIEDAVKAYSSGGLGELSEFLEMDQVLLRGIISQNFPNPSDWITDLERVWRLFHLAVFKQIQSPPIISVSKRSLGYDFRRSQLPAHYTQKYLLLKKQIMKQSNWQF